MAVPARSLESPALVPPAGAGSLRAPGAVLLVSCYELGHQPFGLAMPLAFLERAGFRPAAMDISVEPFDEEKVRRAAFVAIAVPMHTALRLGVEVAGRIREIQPAARICFYGLYAALNAGHLLRHGADFCLGGEIEEELVRIVGILDGGAPGANGGFAAAEPGIDPDPPAPLNRLDFPIPSRAGLPPLREYARLEYRGERRIAGYVEASRGCAHLCTHCPIPPVYGGRFFVLPPEVVLGDIRGQVAGGARHITFGDPDFLNGPGHSLRLVRAMHAEFPEVTFDFTAKVEHILERRELFPELAACGCLFVVSAVESLSEKVLEILRKDHTRADVARALEITRSAGIALRPTWVPFTPWTTRRDFLEILEFVEAQELVDHVDPVQYSIRLLVPPGSLLAAHPAMRPHLGELDAGSFRFPWRHPDPGVDLLQRKVAALVERDARAGEEPARTFYRIRALAEGRDPEAARCPPSPSERRPAPRLSEPWFC